MHEAASFGLAAKMGEKGAHQPFEVDAVGLGPARPPIDLDAGRIDLVARDALAFEPAVQPVSLEARFVAGQDPHWQAGLARLGADRGEPGGGRRKVASLDRVTAHRLCAGKNDAELPIGLAQFPGDTHRGTLTHGRRVRAVSKRIESRGIPELGLFMIYDARRAKEAAEMALSDDLRKRVVEAVTDGGMSRNAAAKRFGVSIASAVRWLHRFAATGEISPAPTGGDRRSDRIEAHRDYLLGLIRRQPDMTLLEIQERLIANCGERFSSSVIWRFFDRHGITFKKKPRMPRSSNARTY